MVCCDRHDNENIINSKCLAHYDCARKAKLIDPYTGDYLCTESTFKRCMKCYRVFKRTDLNLDLLYPQWFKFGCPFCKKIKHIYKSVKNYNITRTWRMNYILRFMIYRTLSIIEYNEIILIAFRNIENEK